MRTNTVQGQTPLSVILDEEEKRGRGLANRITGYLICGGLFNPEMMEHEKVRDLLIDLRDFIGTDVYPLVKALRWAISGLEDSHEIIAAEVACHADEHPDDGCPACVGLCALAAILTSRTAPSVEPKATSAETASS